MFVSHSQLLLRQSYQEEPADIIHCNANGDEPSLTVGLLPRFITGAAASVTVPRLVTVRGHHYTQIALTAALKLTVGKLCSR